MKRIFVGTCILAACAFAVAAGTTQSAGAATQSQVALQEPTEPQQPETPPTEPAPTEPQEPTEPAPTEPPATEPAPTEPGAPMGEEVKLQGCLQEGDEAGTFKLTDAKPPEGGEEAGAPADPAAGAVPADVPSGDITLKAAAGVDLSEHVGHTITVSGSWAEGLEPGAPSGVAEAGATGGGKALEAQSVEMVSASCEGGL